MNIGYQINLFGLNKYFDEISKLYKSKRLPNKIILSGKKGIGKATLAMHIINFIYSKNDDYIYDTNKNIINIKNRSYKLISNGTHPNFFYINKSNDKNFIEISQIRSLNNFINTSSFDNKVKIVMIDDVEYLSKNASNALLKLIEEPKTNILFILIHDNSKYIIETLKSRCINFKINLDFRYFSPIINNYFNTDVYEKIPDYLKSSYLTPLKIIYLIDLCNEHNISLENLDIKNLLKFLINKNIYKTKFFKIDYFKEYIEIYLLKKLKDIKKIDYLVKINYLNKKYNDIIKYNLDIDSFVIDLKHHLINEK